MVWLYLFGFIVKLSLIYAAPTTSNCGKTVACLVEPFDCVNTNCQYIYKWVENSTGSTNFEISIKLGAPVTNGWVAIGFSKDQAMGDDNMVICKFVSASNVRIVEHDYTPGKIEPDYLVSNQPQIGLSDVQVLADDDYLTCKFTRTKKMTTANYYDLATKFYTLAAHGTIRMQVGSPVMMRHRVDDKIISNDLIDFSKVGLYFGS